MEQGWKSSVDHHQISPNCPRCGSSKTKFCYYNNYSLTQPRYFCKDCRRYWTKGGSLRNVPIGGGCRKNRRGKSATLRLSTSDHGVHSKSLAYENPSVYNSYGYSMVDSSSSSSINSALPDGSHIDLALVYTHFLNQPQPEPKSSVEIPGLPSKFDNSLPTIPNKNLDSTIQIPESSIGLFENRTLSEDTPLDQQNRVPGLTTSESTGLPPLPGEELQEMFWSNSQTVESSHSLTATAQDPHLLFGNWSSFDLSGDDTFSGP